MKPKRRSTHRDSALATERIATPLKAPVLVVDDSSDGREMLSEYLAFRGFHVVEARHGAEAIEITRRVHPHIILMDLTMPAMDGWEATRQLKADPATKEIIIIAVSAHAFASERASAREAGCDGFIAKPFDLPLLADVLERVILNGRAGLDPKDVTLDGAPRRRSSKLHAS
jgi:two-component system, cell cycle response regulator DivK